MKYTVTKVSNGYICKNESGTMATVHTTAASVAEALLKEELLKMDVTNGSVAIEINVSNIFNEQLMR